MSILVSVTCKQCGVEWKKTRQGLYGWSGLCRACATRARSDSGPTSRRIPVTCKQCGAEWTLTPLQMPTWSGLCKRCWPEKRDRVTCSECGKSWMKNRQSIKTWDGRCRSCAQKTAKSDPELRARYSELAREQIKRQGGVPNRKVFTPERVRGAANHNWKGGVYPAHKAFRKTKAYQEWRAAVFARDDYTCRACDRRGGYLHAHHVISFAERPDLRLDPLNGLTLCRACHGRRHGKAWH